jgi:hypothetical protein
VVESVHARVALGALDELGDANREGRVDHDLGAVAHESPHGFSYRSGFDACDHLDMERLERVGDQGELLRPCR